MKNNLLVILVLLFSAQFTNAQEKYATKNQISEANFPTVSHTTLPVTYTKMSASIIGDQLVVEWQTANEVNNSHFTVEASNDFVNFKTIGRVECKGIAGRSSAILDYKFSTPWRLLNFAGLGVLGLLLLPAARRKAINYAAILFVIISIAACAKTNVNKIKEEDKKVEKDIYVRVVQIDLDGRNTIGAAMLAVRK